MSVFLTSSRGNWLCTLSPWKARTCELRTPVPIGIWTLTALALSRRDQCAFSVCFLLLSGQLVFNSRMKTIVVDKIERDQSGHGDGIICRKGWRGDAKIHTGFIAENPGPNLSSTLQIPQTAVKLGALYGMRWPYTPSVRVQYNSLRGC